MIADLTRVGAVPDQTLMGTGGQLDRLSLGGVAGQWRVMGPVHADLSVSRCASAASDFAPEVGLTLLIPATDIGLMANTS